MNRIIKNHITDKGLGSYGQLARALKEQFPDLDWPPKDRSLETKIGDIDRGKPGWWRNQPALAKALSEFLDASQADLGLSASQGQDLFGFPEFPELQPLDLKSESPCVIGRPVPQEDTNEDPDMAMWLGEDPGYGLVRKPAAGVYWLYFPEGRGRGLFWAKLRHSSGYECISSTTITAAGSRLKKPGLLILNVDKDSGESDLYALATRHPAVAVLVIAPYPAPIDKNAPPSQLYSHERNSATPLERQRLDLLLLNSHTMRRYEWQLHEDWRDRLLNWVESRLNQTNPDTLFSARGLNDWLATFPFIQQSLSGPGDLLALCRLCHKQPDKKQPGGRDRKAAVSVLEAIHRSSPDQAKQFLQLIEAYWSEQSLPWRKALSRSQWESLISTLSGSPLESEVMALAREADEKKRLQLARRLSKSKPRVDLDDLLKHGLLLPTPADELSPSPRLLADLIARDWIIQKIENDSIEIWGLFCFDAERRSVVDAALDALTEDALLPVAEKILLLPATEAAAIGASEALFYTLAKRIDATSVIPERFFDITHQVLTRSDPLADKRPIPWSRNTATSEAPRIEWQAACWAWSLLPRPANFVVNEAWSWWLPGWASSLSAHPYTAEDLTTSDKAELPPAEWQWLLSLSQQLAKKLESPPTIAPAFMKPALLVEAAEGRWPAEPSWWDDIIGVYWAENLLLKMLQASKNAAAHRILLSLAHSLRAKAQSAPYIAGIFSVSPLRRWLLENVEESQFMAFLKAENMAHLLYEPATLPPRLRSTLLKFASRSPAKHRAYLQQLIPLAGAEDVTILLELLTGDTGETAAASLWRLAPRKTEALLQRDSTVDPDAMRSLILTCPEISIGVRAMATHKGLFTTQERSTWARQWLPNSREHSQEIAKTLKD